MCEADLFFRDYPLFAQSTTMTRGEFNQRWGYVLEEFVRATKRPAPQIDTSHMCGPACCSNCFVSSRFSKSALCLFSGKLHVCEIGGRCPQVMRTDSGDLVCGMTCCVVGVDNILTSYDDGDRSNLEQRATVAQGGIDTEDVTPSLPRSASLDPELWSMLQEVERNSTEQALKEAVRHIPRRPQSKHKAGPSAALARDIIETILKAGRTAHGGSRMDARERELVFVRAPKEIHMLFAAAPQDKPHGLTFYKAFVYAFLYILSHKGIPGMQEGPVVGLQAYLPEQAKIRGLGIQTQNVSRAEREINSLITSRVCARKKTL